MEIIGQLQAVTKHYGLHVVLKNVNLTIERGEMYGLTGPSGVGKTTLLNLLGLLDAPDNGTVNLFGHPAPKPGSRAATHLRRTRLGYLFQNFALIDEATVEMNLEVAWAKKSVSAQSRRLQKEEVLERVGLTHQALRQHVYTLSGGEQQRVAVARLLLKPCDLILADEPTGSVDAANRTLILTSLEELRQKGKTILIVTHDQMVANQCTHVVSLPLLS